MISYDFIMCIWYHSLHRYVAHFVDWWVPFQSFSGQVCVVKIVLECAWMMLLATTSRSHHSASFHSGCFFGFRFACHGLWKSRWDRVLHPTPNTTWADSWCHNPYDYMILYEYVMSQPQPNHIPYSFLLYISVYLHIKPYHDIDPGKPAAEVSQT